MDEIIKYLENAIITYHGDDINEVKILQKMLKHFNELPKAEVSDTKTNSVEYFFDNYKEDLAKTLKEVSDLSKSLKEDLDLKFKSVKPLHNYLKTSISDELKNEIIGIASSRGIYIKGTSFSNVVEFNNAKVYGFSILDGSLIFDVINYDTYYHDMSYIKDAYLYICRNDITNANIKELTSLPNTGQDKVLGYKVIRKNDNTEHIVNNIAFDKNDVYVVLGDGTDILLENFIKEYEGEYVTEIIIHALHDVTFTISLDSIDYRFNPRLLDNIMTEFSDKENSFITKKLFLLKIEKDKELTFAGSPDILFAMFPEHDFTTKDIFVKNKRN